MSHFAKVNDGKVLQVIVAEQDFINNLVDESPGTWIKCSYNIRNGIYRDPTTGEPVANQEEVIAADEGRQRKNYPGVGWNYDETGFYEPQPHKYWTLNKEIYRWEPPFPCPDDGYGYAWSDIDYEEDTADPKTEGWIRITEDEETE
jgi:hypothetical protein